jgi:hypothetical protein
MKESLYNFIFPHNIGAVSKIGWLRTVKSANDLITGWMT